MRVSNPSPDTEPTGTECEPHARLWRHLAFASSLAASVLAFTLSTWPMAALPSYRLIAEAWALVGDSAGLLYLIGAYLVRRRRPIASSVLSIGALLLIGSGLSTGRLLALAELDLWWVAVGIDLLPTVVGGLAALAAAQSVKRGVLGARRAPVPETTERRQGIP